MLPLVFGGVSLVFNTAFALAAVFFEGGLTGVDGALGSDFRLFFLIVSSGGEAAARFPPIYWKLFKSRSQYNFK